MMESPHCIKKRKKHSSNYDGEALSGLGQLLDSTGEDASTSSGPVPTLQQMVLKPSWESLIDSANKRQCKKHIKDLKDLLKRAEDRLASVRKEEERRGLSYVGDDKVNCKCGNSVKQDGRYYASCEWREMRRNSRGPICGEEMCKKCAKKCVCCGLHLCGNCSEIHVCGSCEGPMCHACGYYCECCGLYVCGRFRDESGSSDCRYICDRNARNRQFDGCCNICNDIHSWP